MSEPKIIQPRTLKGFRDLLPGVMQAREGLVDAARAVFRSYGFAPIDTPALEYSEILLGKGGAESDRQLYRFEDQGGRDVALRFDLTVPLARFVAQHIGELGTPFKRYHIGPVWRGENPQRGRYREFMQCDFDVVGTTSMLADIEIALVIHDALAAFDVGEFTLHLNNRKILGGLLAELALSEVTAEVLRSIDKLPKVGRNRVEDELQQTTGAKPAQTKQLLDAVSVKGSSDEVLSAVAELAGGAADEGVGELEEVMNGLAAAGVRGDRVQVDVSIARGLDYYTGTVFETFLNELPDIGSVCSGGRYDDLASLYTKQRLPGVGASIGMDRLLAALEALDRLEIRDAAAPILVALFDAELRSEYLAVASELRAAALGVELYPEPKKLGSQLKYADRKGHRLVVIIGESEREAGTAQIKDMTSGGSSTVARDSLAATCRELLGS